MQQVIDIAKFELLVSAASSVRQSRSTCLIAYLEDVCCCCVKSLEITSLLCSKQLPCILVEHITQIRKD